LDGVAGPFFFLTAYTLGFGFVNGLLRSL